MTAGLIYHLPLCEGNGRQAAFGLAEAVIEKRKDD
jgi:hypothetical protein